MLLDRYNEALDNLICKVRTTQRENIIKAGQMIADTVASGGNVYLSRICHAIENDVIYRGGGPIFLASYARSTTLAVRPDTEDTIRRSPGRMSDILRA